ncbi:hypothetical protein ASZ78_001147 [Callipepla squamata]|uniref:RAP domain-containing protein n=1 Tax=Callipepla squamata TaxID=9009 RepID=A0A226MZ90_CALSU|nr:hypothetical protein ASZ78_001147 [Callipepla squamata]
MRGGRCAVPGTGCGLIRWPRNGGSADSPGNWQDTESKVEHMENEAVVDTLYSILSLSLPALSKFALCLHKQHRHFSPLIGKIAHLVDVKLDSIQDIRILSVLMISVSDVISQSFQDRLLQKAEQLLGGEVHFNYAKRIVQFLQLIKLSYPPLLEKCNKIFLKNTSHLDLDNISLIFGLYEQLGFDNAEFRLIAKQLLSQSIDDYHEPEAFAKLFFVLGPMAGSKVKERMVSVLHRHLDSYHVLQLIHPLEMYFILYLFSVLNYDPPANEEFFESCIQHLTSNLSCFETHHLVLLGYILAVAGYFPAALIKTVFDVSFLSRLDAQLEVLSDTLKQRVRSRLMKLNRAVCLECPEFHIPWFHEQYFQHVLCKGISRINPLRQHVHRLLAEILGGSHYARVSVLTPYYYVIDFECILDKNKKPLSYMSQNILLDDLRGTHLRHDIKDEERKALPQGAHRIALEFLDSKAFSKDSRHLKGEPAVKKRHLEILGYRVIQIPHFEWNSMVLSTKPEQLEYLRKRLYETQ